MRVQIRLVGFGALAFVAAVAIIHVARGTENSANRPAVPIWRDVTGKEVLVVAVEPIDGSYWIADAKGIVWRYDYGSGGISATHGATLFYGSNDCTGTPYTDVWPSRMTIQRQFSDEVRRVPDTIAITALVVGSMFDGSSCTVLGGYAMRAMPYSACPIVSRDGSLATPPFHPEFVLTTPQ